MRTVTRVLGFVVGLYFVVRAAVEPFVIDVSDPATYQLDWGGPSLAGVLLVHCGPGVVTVVLMTWWLVRLSRARGAGRLTGNSAAGGSTAYSSVREVR